MGSDLTFAHMAARTCVVFIMGVILLRIGARRELGHNAGFDILTLVILGSVLSRGINGQAAFFPTLGASAALVALHTLLSIVTSRVHRISRWVKGSPTILVRDGVVNEAALQRCFMSHEDLNESLRANGNVAVPAAVAEARLERNGEVSVVKRMRD